MWDIAISTMWGIGQFQRLTDFFRAGEILGFTGFELNHQVDSIMLNGVRLKDYHVTSVHEPCPADISTDTMKTLNWLVSSPDEDGRQQGVHAVQRSIDLAQELGASLIVFHSGRVDVDQDLECELWDLFEAGQAQTSAYSELKERLVAARAAHADVNLDAARRSLLGQADYAGQAGVRLGLENRYHYLDIPLLDEMNMLLEVVNDGRIGFWHDVGHAQALEHLGFDSDQVWLRRYSSRMLGVHLHDIQGLKDHIVPGLGQMEWDMITAHLPEDAIRVCEFRAFNLPEQVTASMQFLAGKGIIQNA